jgi:hypothetical protein
MLVQQPSHNERNDEYRQRYDNPQQRTSDALCLSDYSRQHHFSSLDEDGLFDLRFL